MMYLIPSFKITCKAVQVPVIYRVPFVDGICTHASWIPVMIIVQLVVSHLKLSYDMQK